MSCIKSAVYRNGRMEEIEWGEKPTEVLYFKDDGGSQVVSTGPWGPQIPYLNQLFSQASQLMANPPQYYPGSTVAPQNPNLSQSQQNITNFSNSQQGINQQGINTALQAGTTGFANPVLSTGMPTSTNNTNAINSLLAGGPQADTSQLQSYYQSQLNPELNPNLQGAIDAATTGLTRNFQYNTMPTLASGGNAAQPGGGTREGIAEGIAATNYNQDVANTVNQLTSQAFQQQQQQSMNAANSYTNMLLQQNAQQAAAQQAGVAGSSNLLTQGNQQGIDQMIRSLSLLPILQGGNMNLLGANNTIGLQQQGFDQANLDDSVNRWFFNQYMPFNMLSQFQNYVGGSYGSSTNP